MSSRTHSTTRTRQYTLRKVKHNRSTKGKRSYEIVLDPRVINKGCVLNKIATALQQQFPHLRVQRVGENLQLSRKKRSLFGILDPVVAKAIDQTDMIHAKIRDKARKGYRSERRLKVLVNTPTGGTIRDRNLAGRIAGASHGTWLDADDLAAELACGHQVLAVV